MLCDVISIAVNVLILLLLLLALYRRNYYLSSACGEASHIGTLQPACCPGTLPFCLFPIQSSSSPLNFLSHSSSFVPSFLSVLEDPTARFARSALSDTPSYCCCSYICCCCSSFVLLTCQVLLHRHLCQSPEF